MTLCQRKKLQYHYTPLRCVYKLDQGVMFTKSPKHTQVKKEKLTTYMRSRAHLKSSQRYAYCQCQVEQADCENMLLQAPRGLALLT